VTSCRWTESDFIAQALKAAAMPRACLANGTSGRRRLPSGKRGFDEAIVTSGQHFDFKPIRRSEYPKGNISPTS
jgi:hypothetical protein